MPQNADNTDSLRKKEDEIYEELQKLYETTCSNLKLLDERKKKVKNINAKSLSIMERASAFNRKATDLEVSMRPALNFNFYLIITFGISMDILFLINGSQLINKEGIAKKAGYFLLMASFIIFIAIILAVLYNSFRGYRLNRVQSLQDMTEKVEQLTKSPKLDNGFKQSLQDMTEKIEQSTKPLKLDNDFQRTVFKREKHTSPGPQYNLTKMKFGSDALRRLNFKIPEGTEQKTIMRNLEISILCAENSEELFRALNDAKEKLEAKSTSIKIFGYFLVSVFDAGGTALNYVCNELMPKAVELYGSKTDNKANLPDAAPSK